MKGYTLLEVLVAVSILAVSSVYIFRSFFSALSAIEMSENRIAVMNAFNNDAAEIKFAVENRALSLPFNKSGEIKRSGTRYKYLVASDKPVDSKQLCRINIDYAWRQSGKTVHEKREIFTLYPADK